MPHLFDVDNDLCHRLAELYRKTFNLSPLSAKMYAFLIFDFQGEGLSFEDLEKVATFLSEDKEEVTTENIELLQKVEGTSLLEAIEKALPQVTLKVSALLEKALPKTIESKMEFDIREFV